ncbi:sialin-like [Hydractinia symbiolongicarpus]|uniref:sialin-like n=1 Tax=Hydractinia symbiolongicarpus TaxID=13093 RepID=UPI0025500A5E|nr:sialin-like [Hydractinia symbiolongicarpus]
MALPYIPKRYILTFMAHLGFFVVYALRVNLSVALVAMVNSTYAHGSSSFDPECGGGNKTVKENNGEFKWNQNQQGLILSSFFYGYLFTQLPGGWWANKHGGKWVFGLGVLGTSVLTLVTPLAAKCSFYLLIAVRVLEGVGEGVTFPAMHAMIAQWSPPAERSRMSVFAYAGMHTGTIFAMPVSGVLADSTFLGGWPSVFYVFGSLGLIWFLVWSLVVYNSPEKHPTISYEERSLISRSLKNSSSNTKIAPTPWFSFLKSIRVWALIWAHFSNNWVWYMVLTGLPSYFKQVLDFKLTENAFLSALPFIVAFLIIMMAGAMADYLRKGCLSTTATRRLMGVLGYYPTSIFLILASYAGCDEIGLSVTYMVLATACLSFNCGGYMVNHLDISPRYSGILMGVSNLMGTVAGCVTPSVTGFFTNDHPTRLQYRKVFAIASSICAAGGTFFIIFVTGKQQSWNDIKIAQAESSTGKSEQDDEECLVNSQDVNVI